MQRSVFCVSVDSSKVSQYGNEAPGAPSLQAELAKLREENSVLKRSAKGLWFLKTLYIFSVKYGLVFNLGWIFDLFDVIEEHSAAADELRW